METCARGFSYMPPKNIDENLQYIENDELERTWKVSRRQRLKEQEQLIWEEFVKEQDIVKKAYEEDPYQFLHDLPESCIKELMEEELQKMIKESETDVIAKEQQNLGEGDHSTENQAVHVVTLAEEGDKADTNYQLFFDDELNLSEDEVQSPSTVRERQCEDLQPGDDEDDNDAKDENKSSKHVTSLIETSIYCARVKHIRNKINDELISIMASLDIQDVMTIESEEVSRRCRRSAEFCARFNRIHMYQLQRQMHDISRHERPSLPFCLRTQFQAQMSRVDSLHVNLLRALQVFHKSFPKTSCLRESGEVLRELTALLRECSALCRGLSVPRECDVAHLYTQDIVETCDKLDEAVNEYNIRVADFLIKSGSIERSSNPPSIRYKSRRSVSHSKSGSSGKELDTRLSMYSFHGKSSHSKDHSRVPFTTRVPLSAVGSKSHEKLPEKKPNKTTRKMHRRPLMRAPYCGHSRPKLVEDTDIMTMVEDVVTSPLSCEYYQNVASPTLTPRNSRKTTPSKKAVSQNTKVKNRRSNTKSATKKNVLASSETQTSISKSKTAQCAKKQPNIAKKESPNTKNSSKTNEYSKDVTQKDQDSKNNVNYNDKDVGTYQDLGKRRRRRGRIGSPGKEDGYTDKECDISRQLNNISTSQKEDGDSGRHRSNIVSPCKEDGYSGKGSDSGKQRYNVSSTGKEDGYSGKGSDSGKQRYNVSSTGKEDGYSGKGSDSGKQRYKVGSPGKEDGYTGQERDSSKQSYNISCPSRENAYIGKECVGLGFTECDAQTEFPKNTLKKDYEAGGERIAKGKNKVSNMAPASCKVTKLLLGICSPREQLSGSKNEKVSGVKNAQLHCVKTGSLSPKRPSTPQLLRILEETIQKQAPKPVYEEQPRNPDRFRLSFNIPDATAMRVFQYRTKFVQHMLTSAMYANSAVGKPWEMIGSVTEQIMDEILTDVAKEMLINDALRELYMSETN